MNNPYELDINIILIKEHYSKIPRTCSPISSSSSESKDSIKCYNPIKKQRIHNKNYLLHNSNNKRIRIN